MIGRKTTGCAGAVMSIQIRRGAEPSGRYSGAPGSSSNTTPAISTSSPGSKPALSSAAITPSRCRRRSTCASASSFSRSWRAIRRSTTSPVTRNSPGAEPLDLELARGRRAEDAVLGEVVLAGVLAAPARRPARGAAARARARRGPRRWRCEVTSTGTSGPAARASRAAAASASSGVTRSALESARIARQRRQARVVLGQLALDHRVVRRRVGAVERREVEHVHEQPRALDVGEEVVAEAGAVARALDQARDVGDHELAVGGLERAEVRLERRERVAGDLRLRAREPRDQRRLAGVRQPDEPDVGQQLEVQLDEALLAVAAPSRPAAAPGARRS